MRMFRVWKDMSLDNTISEYERSKLAVWDYPVSDKYTKVGHLYYLRVLISTVVLDLGKYEGDRLAHEHG